MRNKRLYCIFLFVIICNFLYALTANTAWTGSVNNLSDGLYVPLGECSYNIQHNPSSQNYNVSNAIFYNGSYGAKLHTTNMQQHVYCSYSGGSYSTVSNATKMRSTSGAIKISNGLKAKGRTKTCPMCHGTGYINNNGDGELVTADWWRMKSGYAGDGTFCDGVEAYHDPCDAEWSETGGTYHHDYKRVCPMCNGTKVVSNKTSISTRDGEQTWTDSQTGTVWVLWNGESWSHPYADSDNDGHCDQHWWHTPIKADSRVYLFMAPIFAIYVAKKIKKEESND